MLPDAVEVGAAAPLPASYLPQVMGRASTACASVFSIYNLKAVYEEEADAETLLAPQIVKDANGYMYTRIDNMIVQNEFVGFRTGAPTKFTQSLLSMPLRGSTFLIA